MESVNFTGNQPLSIAIGIAGVIIAAKTFDILYALFFHPLKDIPGPWYSRASRLPYARHLLKGSSVTWLHNLHNKYGPVVMYSPNEVSVIDGETAWQEIYGFRTGKQKGTSTFLKDRVWYAPPIIPDSPSLITTDDAAHSRQRRILSHAFSEKSLRNQEWLIQQYADLLVSRLKDTTMAANKPANMTEWYNWITFDIISDLMFGKPFGCLAETHTHKYVALLLNAVKAFSLFYIMNHWPLLKSLQKYVMKPALLKARLEWIDFVKTFTIARMESDTERHDFMTDILAKQHDEQDKGNQGISTNEIISNANLLTVAGTETTATVLTCTTFLMLKHGEAYQKVRDEVRSKFTSQEDITIEAANQLPYTIAVLNEGMRMVPPVPAGFVRKVPKEGAFVSGYWLDGNCNASVSVSQYPANHSTSNFRDADQFVPERWLGDAKYADDKRGAFSPFSFGPRNCLGKNLAYAEMRVILAKMVFNFDMVLEEESKNWLDGMEVRTLWVKAPLKVGLTAVR
ncbi:cytochrome P450 monooxygenase [Elsinoe ampelina]|uniref:Cytochrome P450 monooxygenase n=1 Tax=Elsinoe ampelina TaxID=302913 RepID=A0A6A6G5Z7_9PEZI|nr:cytochrome P450 monooxygenase [Elsinoe ampelina]